MPKRVFGAARLALAAAAGCAAPLVAQDLPRQRTGPDAEPPRTSDYAEPLSMIEPVVTVAPEVSAGHTALVVSDVRVIEAQEPDRPPPPGWGPLKEDLSGLKLEHRSGELLDAGWVRRQFERNGLVGGGETADRALALVQLINATFVSAGFINSGLIVPRQNALTDNTLTLELIHGRLAAADGGPAISVVFANGSSRGLTSAYVTNRMPSVNGRPLSGVDVERDFRLLADDPAIRTVNADLRPGSRPGEATLKLLIDPQERLDIYVTGGNSRSPSVGGERIAAGGSVRNLLTPGDLLSAEAGMTKGLDDYTASYATPFITPALSLSLRGSINNAAVVDSQLVPLDIRSRDRAGEVGLGYALLREPLTPMAERSGWLPARSLLVGAMLAYRRSRSFLLGQPFSFAPGSVDGRSNYTAMRVTGDYLVRTVKDVFAVSVTGTMGLGGTRSNAPGALNPDKNFKAVLVQLNYARRLTAQRLELRARLTGQYADSILYSGERLSTGGERTVRGYRENLLLTDKGLVGSIELSQPFSLSKGTRSGFDWGSFAVAGFADAAQLDNHKRVAVSTRSVYSVGGSLSWTPSDAVTARVSYGIALKSVGNLGKRDVQDRGLHVSFTFHPLRLFE